MCIVDSNPFGNGWFHYSPIRITYFLQRNEKNNYKQYKLLAMIKTNLLQSKHKNRLRQIERTKEPLNGSTFHSPITNLNNFHSCYSNVIRISTTIAIAFVQLQLKY